MNSSSATALSRPPQTRHRPRPSTRSPATRRSRRDVQDAHVQIERRTVRERKPEDGRKDDRRVREHHRHDEPEEDGVERGVVHQARHRDAGDDGKRSAHTQPRIAAEQADGHEPRHTALTDRPPRDVVTRQPPRQREESRAHRARTPARATTSPPRRRRGSSRSRRRRSSGPRGVGRSTRLSSSRSPAIVSTRNASHQNTTPNIGAPPSHSSVAGRPRQRAHRHRRHEERRLPPPYDRRRSRP